MAVPITNTDPTPRHVLLITFRQLSIVILDQQRSVIATAADVNEVGSLLDPLIEVNMQIGVSHLGNSWRSSSIVTITMPAGACLLQPCSRRKMYGTLFVMYTIW